jgi:nucleoid DNA-binding protein
MAPCLPGASFGGLFTRSRGQVRELGGSLTKKEIVGVFDALQDLVKKELGRRGPGEFVIPDMIKLKVRKIPAKPARMGRNPATGEEMMLPPKAASKKIRATPLKKLKDLVL